MVSIQEELALATGMCSDILSIVEGYIWQPFKDIKFDYNHTGGGNGYLINIKASNLQPSQFDEEIELNATELFYPVWMNIIKKRTIIRFFLFKKAKTIYYHPDFINQSVRKKIKIFEAVIKDFNKEFDDERSPGFSVIFPRLGRVCIAETTLAVICDYILKQIQHKYIAFPRDLSLIEVSNYLRTNR